MADSLATLQQRWADHVRDPSMPAPDGIDARRLAVYRRLCIDSLDSLLAGSLPRLQAQLGGARWRSLVEHYYAHHVCHTPLFPQIASEFAAWLAVQDTFALPVWAAELAHYESTQQALYIEAREAGLQQVHAPEADSVLAVSPWVRVLGYQWPVHEDAALPEQPAATPTLLLLRRQADFGLQVEELPPLAYALLSACGDEGARVDDALQALADAHGVAAEELREVAVPVLGELCAAGVLVVLTGF
ncbi:TPA: putative DNA-binding domain-containing protein [Stenotrophomonas maltophilia]|nr:putative DNA-binding domain-containing protein [Stenotrophomonas maltophilia]HDS1027752.1 putative DNA-binding domain-containing protein [Stenotrophomonas maltophilia]HDS1028549.1 putative DNA-binding domain-containing protein [Stenotrophomonas maltophilia]HDS1034277.1 putative DNA-binding domain-containing protein [Stenotrophomonas maltophilia]